MSDRADWILDLVTNGRDRTWLNYAKAYLTRLSDPDLCEALQEDPERLKAYAVFPSKLGRHTATWLSEMLCVNENDSLVNAALRHRQLPEGGVRVAPESLRHSTHPTAALRLLAGSGPIDLQRCGHQGATLSAVLPDRAHYIADSRLWLKALLYAPKPLVALTLWVPKRIVDLAPHTRHPHAVAAITALCKRDPSLIMQHLPDALATTQTPGVFLDAVCAGAPGMPMAALHEAIQHQDLAAICQGWLGVMPRDVVIDWKEFPLVSLLRFDTHGITTLGDLMAHPPAVLKRWWGRSIFNWLQELLARYGLTFPDAPASPGAKE